MLTLLLLACQVSGGPEPAAPAAPAQAAPPPPQAQAETMPPLSPSGPFMTWLSAQESTLLLPFEIQVDPLGISGAALLGEPPVPMSLDTGAMGIALDTRLQEFCPGEEVCKVWLKGRYGPLLGDGLAPAGHTFTVYEVIESVQGAPTQARRE